MPQVLLWARKKIEHAKCCVPLAQPRQKPRGGIFPLIVTFIHGMWTNHPFPPCAMATTMRQPQGVDLKHRQFPQSNSALWMGELLDVPSWIRIQFFVMYCNY